MSDGEIEVVRRWFDAVARPEVDAALDASIVAVVQPGGSVRDDEVVAAADKGGVPMLFSGARHFRH